MHICGDNASKCIANVSLQFLPESCHHVLPGHWVSHHGVQTLPVQFLGWMSSRGDKMTYACTKMSIFCKFAGQNFEISQCTLCFSMIQIASPNTIEIHCELEPAQRPLSENHNLWYRLELQEMIDSQPFNSTNSLEVLQSNVSSATRRTLFLGVFCLAIAITLPAVPMR